MTDFNSHYCSLKLTDKHTKAEPTRLFGTRGRGEKPHRFFFLTSISVFFLLFTLAACKDDPNDPNPIIPKTNTNMETPVDPPDVDPLNEAEFSARRDHSSVVHANKIWVIGGLATDESIGDNTRVNDVWSSTDGTNWTEATPAAGFSARRNHSSVVYKENIWVIGGISNVSASTRLNDVWSSPDGITWTQATDNAGFPARGNHSSVVFSNRIWVIGGSSGGNDVWSSTDGTNWTEVTNAAAFGNRSFHSSVVHAEKIWLIGGFNAAYQNDVWSSINGTNWARARATGSAGFSGRRDHSSVVHDSKIWVIGGKTGSSSITNDVWSSANGITWTEMIPNAGFSAREGHSSVVFRDRIWVIGGGSSEEDLKNDVWSFSP